jgi:hypothetical protein
MKRSLVTRTVGPLLLLRQSQDDPSESEWMDCITQLDALLEAMGTGAPTVKVLVYTDGGAPTERQRGMLQRSLAKNPVRVAVITDNLKARITSATVALGNRNQRSFSTAEWSRAYAYLGLSPEEKRSAEAVLKTMAKDLA